MTDRCIEQIVQTTVSLQDAYQYVAVDKTFVIKQQSDLKRCASTMMTMCSIGVGDPVFCSKSGHNTIYHADLIPISKLTEYTENDIQFIGIINHILCVSVNETPYDTADTVTIRINCITNGSIKFNTASRDERDDDDIYVKGIHIGKRHPLFEDVVDLCL